MRQLAAAEAAKAGEEKGGTHKPKGLKNLITRNL
jgi:hypothetical protein